MKQADIKWDGEKERERERNSEAEAADAVPAKQRLES